jgi:hypothetical protein
MKTHAESTHSKLIVFKKLATIEELVYVSHNWQLGKKWFRPFGCVIMAYFCVTNLYKKFDDAQH